MSNTDPISKPGVNPGGRATLTPSQNREWTQVVAQDWPHHKIGSEPRCSCNTDPIKNREWTHVVAQHW
jgi:hypothetical protein